MPRKFWLVKQEPEAYSWASFLKDGRTAWTGVRNFQARNNLRAMQRNDWVLYYHSVTQGGGNWVQFKLTGTKSNRDAIGARITLTAGGLTQIQEIDGGNGYAGQSTKRAHMGIGTAAKIDSMEIRWPSGLKEKIEGVAINKISRITEGKGLQK